MGFKAWTREKAIEQFWARVDKTGPCWLWIGKGRGGSLHYGSLKLPVALADGVPRRTTLAHRVAFYLTRGYWPINTRHTCDTPLCCNPDHLIEGTQADNIHDCITRGRARNGNIKLNPEIWKAIRNSSGPAWIQAEKYGIHEAHARKIRRGASGIVYRP